LVAATDGESFAVPRWHEYERATFGRRAIESSRGLAKLVGVEDQADEQLVTEDEGGELMLERHRSEYRLVAEAGYAARVLEAIERDGGRVGAAFFDDVVRTVQASKGGRNHGPIE
jgi:hypothetical protein